MSDSFPSSRAQGLTMLYLQNQDLSRYNPDDIAQLYIKTQKEIESSLRKYTKELR